MFVTPLYEKDAPSKKAWCNVTIYDAGIFYSFFSTGILCKENPTGYATALDVFQSKDGVHWDRISELTCPIPTAHAGYGIKKIGAYFYYYPTCSNEEKGVHFKIYRTKDFITWEHLGNEYDVVPNRAYYHERWDELYIYEELDKEGIPLYYGYISSETREDCGKAGAGFLKSRDGIHWDVLPPIVIEWGETPAQHMELNFMEKIGDLYYLSMAGRMYMDSYGYSNYTFVGESLEGPFRPDLEKFRFSGTSRREVTWLGHTIKTDSAMLCALWLSHAKNPDIPSRNFAIGSLKRVLQENNHIRLAYWNNTDKAKSSSLPMPELQWVHPAPTVKTERDCMTMQQNKVHVSASRDGVILLFDHEFNRNLGFFIEGSFTVLENRQFIATHQHAASVGFYFEKEPQSGIAILADTLGVTRTGTIRYSNQKITDFNIYENAGWGLSMGRSGELQGTLQFDYEDTVGALGHASYCGIRHNTKHSFRLLAKGDYFELFINDFYVQTYVLPEKMTGKVGLCLFDGTVTFENIQLYNMI